MDGMTDDHFCDTKRRKLNGNIKCGMCEIKRKHHSAWAKNKSRTNNIYKKERKISCFTAKSCMGQCN